MSGRPLPPKWFGARSDRDFTRDDINKFVERYTFSEEKKSAYLKARKLANLIDGFGTLCLILFVFSVFALVAIPIYSLFAGIIINNIPLPEIAYQYINETPSIQAGTIAITGVLLTVSFLLSLVSFRLSSTFENYASKTGIDEVTIELGKVAEAYVAFESNNYESAIQKLDSYNGYKSAGHLSSYVSSAKTGTGIDEDYLLESFDDFIGLWIESLYTRPSSRSEMMRAITERTNSEYLVGDEEETAPETEEYKKTYSGIIFHSISATLSKVPSKIRALGFARPVVVYLAFLAVGVVLIDINPTLAIVSITVLTAAYGSWRRRGSEEVDSGEFEEEEM